MEELTEFEMRRCRDLDEIIDEEIRDNPIEPAIVDEILDELIEPELKRPDTKGEKL
ncbi:MAG: hypothetical protein K8S18_19680 [Desulfobacula sp.]|nr:hypothetical protein [Desulfobacula sp.]